jgi:hypothetical protein
MKSLLIFILFTVALIASEINPSLLQIHATLFPKTILMDYNFKKKLYNQNIVLALIYDEHNRASAKLLKKKIETKYHDSIHNYPLKIVLSSYDETLSSNLKATSYYLFPSEEKNIISLINLAAQNHSITFAYHNKDLQYGAMISTEIAMRVKPIINIDALKRETISLRPILLKISKIYYQETSSTLMRVYDKFTLYYV